jgi:hypothetical protein
VTALPWRASGVEQGGIQLGRVSRTQPKVYSRIGG